MPLGKLKLPSHETVQTVEQVSETTRSLLATLSGRPIHIRPTGDAPGLTELLLALRKFLEVTLSGIVVSIQIGNVLICVSMLLLGPAFILGALPQ